MIPKCKEHEQVDTRDYQKFKFISKILAEVTDITLSVFSKQINYPDDLSKK